MASEDIKEALKSAAIQIRDEKQAGANTALRVGSLLLAICEALNISTEELTKIFLRKDIDDRSAGIIASDRGFEAGKFNVGATGAACYKDKDGNWHIETDHLKVRKKAVFSEVEIETTYHVGGQQISTGASMVVDYVLEMPTCYRCYFLKKNGEGREINNQWKPNDQAYCNTFNLAPRADGTSGNHYLWRLVEATSNETKDDAETRIFGEETIKTSDYHFADLSKSVYAVDSDAPEQFDEIVLLGHRGDDESRQGCIIVAGAGEGSPYIYEFAGINSFVLPEPEIKIKPGDSKFTGVMHIEGGSTGAKNLEDFPEEVFKAVQIGSVNLLRNSGFTGDYKAEDLSASYALKSDCELFSKKLKHWTGTASVAEEPASVSGKSATIGSLSQTVEVMAGESYVVSFMAKGTGLSVALGNSKETISLKAEYDKYSVKFVSDGVCTFSISDDASVFDLQLERGTIATDWHPSPYDNDKTLAEFQALKYIQDAIVEGDTTILGGLILSSLIMLGNYKDGKMEKVNAGMSGIYNDDDDVAFWGGGTFEQAIHTIVKFKQNPQYRPTEEEWRDMANFVVSHGGDLFLRGYIHALGGYFRGDIFAKGGTIGGFDISEKSIDSRNEGYAVNQSMKLSPDGIHFDYAGGINAEVGYGSARYDNQDLSDIPFAQMAYIKNNAMLQWAVCGLRMTLQARDLGLFIEGGSTHILSSGITHINGLTLNHVIVSESKTLPTNADSVVFSNTEDIEVRFPSVPSGKVLYFKRIGSGGVTLKGSIRPSDSSDVIHDHSLNIGTKSVMAIYQGLGWTIFQCG